MIGSYGLSTRVIEQIAGLTPNLKVNVLETVLCRGYPRDGHFKGLDRLAAAIAERHQEHGLV